MTTVAMPSTRALSPEYELTTRENGHRDKLWEARGDIIKKGTQTALATVFGEGASLVAAEDEVWMKAQEWLRKRRRAR